MLRALRQKHTLHTPQQQQHQHQLHLHLHLRTARARRCYSAVTTAAQLLHSKNRQSTNTNNNNTTNINSTNNINISNNSQLHIDIAALLFPTSSQSSSSSYASSQESTESSSSTTTTTTTAAVFLPTPSRTPLPNTPSEVSAPSHALAEKLAMISACIHSGDIPRAEILYHRSARLHPSEHHHLQSTGMINAFIEGYLFGMHPDSSSSSSSSASSASASVQGNLKKALEWHERARSFIRSSQETQHSNNYINRKDTITAAIGDITTYSILVAYAVRQNNVQLATQFIHEMDEHCLPHDAPLSIQLLESSWFHDPEDRAVLLSILKSLGKVTDSEAHFLAKDATHLPSSILSTLDDALYPDGYPSQPKDLLLSALTEASSSNDTTSSQSSSQLQQPTPQKPHHPLASTPLLETKSSGVNILRETLATLSRDPTLTPFQLQHHLESKAVQAAIQLSALEKDRLPEDLRMLFSLPSQIMAQWNKDLVPLIQLEMQAMASATQDPDEYAVLPFLKMLSVEQLSRITITEFLRVPSRVKDDSETAGLFEGVNLTIRILSNIGKNIEKEHNLQQLALKKNRRMIETQHNIHNLHMKGRLFDATMRKVIAKLAQKQEETDAKTNWRPSWPETTHVKAGAVLSALLMKVAKITVPVADPNDPTKDIMTQELAFEHSYILQNQKRVGVIKFHPLLLERLSSTPPYIHPRLLPMVVKPQPWVTRNSGGYLTHKSDVIRASNNAEHLAYIRAADERMHLNHVFESLDILGSIGWRVNERIYKVMMEIWNKGSAIGGFPVPDSQLPPPLVKPADFNTWKEDAKKAFMMRKRKLDTERRNAFSQRCDLNYKLEIARAFLGETIYFPHNVDFRGRAYPLPAHLNHMGNDVCRGLLVFEKAKPLGKTGLRWLKIQVANLAGYDKASFADREAFTNERIKDVMDSADNPLEGNKWWLKGEDPWQLLATCMELTDALRMDHPEQFLSRMPIHQDGTCNGLQHYAALGGDTLGAAQVNLIPSEKPSDIYTAVADRVAARIEKDAEKGCQISLKMRGKVNRKLVKQTVMTNTYGVTFIGARKQVASRLKEQPDLYPFTEDEIRQVSLHITNLIFDGLAELFKGARSIQAWLNTTARMIAKSVPAENIPEIQLKDAAFLNSMGCLPSAFTVAKTEVEETQQLNDPSSILSNDTLLNAALDDTQSQTQDDTLSDLFNLDDPTLFDPALETASAAADEAIATASTTAKREKSKQTRPDKMTSVIWTTPLGLPIVQPYRESNIKQVRTLIQTVNVVDNHTPSPVNPMKQSTAFPPNFIHSLDATHMMLSAIASHRAGLAFAAVHDSYWTHACDVDTMSMILRDAFVKLHSMDVMQKLRQELVERYAGHRVNVVVELKEQKALQMWKSHLKETGREHISKTIGPKTRKRKIDTWVDLEIPPLPPRGEFDIELVRDSPYFFH